MIIKDSDIHRLYVFTLMGSADHSLLTLHTLSISTILVWSVNYGEVYYIQSCLSVFIDAMKAS